MTHFSDSLWVPDSSLYFKAGEELFLDYEYDPQNCPEWFLQEYLTFLDTLTDEDESHLHSKYAGYLGYLRRYEGFKTGTKAAEKDNIESLSNDFKAFICK